MNAMKRLIPALVLLAAGFAPAGAPGDEPPTEIRLGKPKAPAPRPDPSYARAAERFLAARQSASIDRSREPAARRWLPKAVKVDTATLIGSPGQRLVAFQLPEGGIEPLGIGGFRATVYLLFADAQGRVAETRDEVLTFVGSRETYVCGALKTASTMRWDSEDVRKSAERLHSREAYERADEFLKDWVNQQRRTAAYSMQDFYPAGSGKIMIPCLRFTAEVGKRGYEVLDSPIIMKRGPRGYQIEIASN
ncbi:MAG: hypothetical protein E6K71_00860 [Candidatus Eisenbacteria bacterium]|uniref:Uncharacterized protein n=1 Tax=Eiseniibacteriota bacterium TaxID=2212470 RepID=A0A538SIA9_UNCEI|nr:MAG: hypothetical protein E6K71_00860 [Candidatus Eisenbacteria bacterium]